MVYFNFMHSFSKFLAQRCIYQSVITMPSQPHPPQRILATILLKCSGKTISCLILTQPGRKKYRRGSFQTVPSAMGRSRCYSPVGAAFVCVFSHLFRTHIRPLFLLNLIVSPQKMIERKAFVTRGYERLRYSRGVILRYFLNTFWK